MNDNKFLSVMAGILCFVVLAAIVVGILFAVGVFNKNNVKLPITYPSEEYNWVELEDGTLRVAVDKNINITKDGIYLICDINNFHKNGEEFGLNSDGFNLTPLNYTVYGFDGTGSYEASEDVYVEYEITILLYNNAILTEDGDITAGDGFVVEFSDFALYDDDSSTFIPDKITNIKIFGIYELGDNVQLLD